MRSKFFLNCCDILINGDICNALIYIFGAKISLQYKNKHETAKLLKFDNKIITKNNIKNC